MRSTLKLVFVSAVFSSCVMALVDPESAVAKAGVPATPTIVRVSTVQRSASVSDVVVVLRHDFSRSSNIIRSEVQVGSRKCTVPGKGRTCTVKGVRVGLSVFVKARSIGQQGPSRWGRKIQYVVRLGNQWTAHSSKTTTTSPTITSPSSTLPTTARPGNTSSTTTTTTTTTPAIFDARGFEAEVFRLTNQERNSAGLSGLSACPRLDDAARGHSQRMLATQFYSHDDPGTGKTLTDRIRDTGYLAGSNDWTTGENIAMGYSSAAALVEGWMNSPGHRANILKPEFTHLGVGVTLGAWEEWRGRYNNWNRVTFSTQNFGKGGTCTP